MRVLYFVERFWPELGGVEVASALLVPALAARGHEMLVVTNQETSESPQSELYGDVPVRRLPFTRAFHDGDVELLASCRAAMREVIAGFRPELIHAILTGPGTWLLPERSSVPLIVAVHSDWPASGFHQPDGVFARVLKRAAWVTAVSEHVHADLLQIAPDVRGRSSVINRGLDAPFEGEPREPPPGPPVLLASGRLVEEKGMDVAIDAFAQVAGDHPDARLVIAGDGPAREALIERAAGLGLADRVEFPGWVAHDRVHELVERSSIVLIPSRLEGFGLVALEAALMSRPVLGSSVGGLPEVILDGLTGLLVPVDDSSAMATAIRSLLDDPQRARALGHNARKRALGQFSAARQADQWDALYRRLAATADAPAAEADAGKGPDAG